MDYTVESSLPSLPSPATTTVTMLTQLVFGEKENMRSWLRTEMNSLVDPLIDTLFRKLTNKLSNQCESNDGQIMNPTESHLQFPIIGQPATTQSLPSQIDHFNCLNQSINHSIDSISFESQQSIKNEMEQSSNVPPPNVPPNVPQISDQVQQNPPQSNEQQQLSYDDYEEEEDDDCDCDDCLNGGLDPIKQEFGDDGEMFEKQEEESPQSASKRPRLELTNPLEHESSRQEQHEQNVLEMEENEEEEDGEPNRLFITVLSVQCPECSQMFATKGQLNAHALSQHDMPPLRCVVKDCPFGTQNHHDLSQHIKTVHTGTNISSPLHCSHCVRHFPTYSQLSSHTTSRHLYGQFQCSFTGCPFVANYREKVYNHSKRAHKPGLACHHPGCEHVAQDATNLRRHQRTHLGHRPYRCSWPGCRYAGTQRAHTVGHILRIHLRSRGSRDDAAGDTDPNRYVEVMHEFL